jgi:hypothetical protein
MTASTPARTYFLDEDPNFISGVFRKALFAQFIWGIVMLVVASGHARQFILSHRQLFLIGESNSFTAMPKNYTECDVSLDKRMPIKPSWAQKTGCQAQQATYELLTPMEKGVGELMQLCTKFKLYFFWSEGVVVQTRANPLLYNFTGQRNW